MKRTQISAFRARLSRIRPTLDHCIVLSGESLLKRRRSPSVFIHGNEFTEYLAYLFIHIYSSSNINDIFII